MALTSVPQSWDTILDALAREREVIAIDLPASGQPRHCRVRSRSRRCATRWPASSTEQDLAGIDLVDSSMGVRMVLELARRGVGGTAVALDPGGSGARAAAGVRHLASRVDQTGSNSAAGTAVAHRQPVTRTVLLAQFSARPWALSPDFTLREL